MDMNVRMCATASNGGAMKGDFTRFRTGNESRYTHVLQQQGRVSLDSDWNEAASIAAWQRRQRTIDGFGHFAAIGDAFRVTHLPLHSDFAVEPGRAYVAGMLVEWEPEPEIDVEFEKDSGVVKLHTEHGFLQPGDVYKLRPIGANVETFIRIDSVEDTDTFGTVGRVEDLSSLVDRGSGTLQHVRTYRTQNLEVDQPITGRENFAGVAGTESLTVLLDVWEHHVTAVEDPGLLEEALGGPDTTTRIETDWALRVLPTVASEATCSASTPNLTRAGAQARGRLSVSVAPEDAFEDPCLAPTDARYRGPESRLYRIEVHKGNNGGTSLDGVTLKWSRNNGAAVAAARANNGETVKVVDLGSDLESLSYAPLVELFDVINERTPSPGTLLEPIANPDPTDDQIRLPEDVTNADGREWHHETLRARRWDGALQELEPGAQIELELGITMSFSEGSYTPGDYWLIPARANTGAIQELQDKPPLGVTHHYAKLAVFEPGSSAVELTDCRPSLRPSASFTSKCTPIVAAGGNGHIRAIDETTTTVVGGDESVAPAQGRELAFKAAVSAALISSITTLLWWILLQAIQRRRASHTK
jgi:hypothetical protein